MKIIQDKDRGEIAVHENDSHISKWCEEHHSILTDQTVRIHLLPLIPVDGVVVDIGANIGTHTVPYAEKVGVGGNVLAFEPYKPSFECLQFNCKNLTQVSNYNVALGWNYGQATLVMPGDTNLGAMAIDYAENGDVQVQALDDYRLDKCDFIKIDVEGFEVLALFGAAGTIGKCRPRIYIELNDGALKRMGRTKQDVMGFFAIRDYTHRFLDPTHTLEMSQVDVLFEPK